MDADTFARWQFEHRLTLDVLARVERVEHTILDTLGLPHRLADLEAALASAPPADRRARTRAARGQHALVCLTHIAQTRQWLDLGHENAAIAAHEALLAGLYADDHALRAVTAQAVAAGRRRGGVKAATTRRMAGADMLQSISAIKRRARVRLSDRAAIRLWLRDEDPAWDALGHDAQERRVENSLRQLRRARARARTRRGSVRKN